MMKALGWAAVSLVAVFILACAMLDIVSESTARARDAAIADVRARTDERAVEQDLPVTSVEAGVGTTAPLSVSHEDCGTIAARWNALEKRVRPPSYKEDPAANDLRWKMRNLARGYIVRDFDESEFSGDDWYRFVQYSDSQRADIDAVKTELLRYDPACSFLPRLETPEFLLFDLALDIDLAIAVHRIDYESAIENLTARISLAYMAQGFKFPFKFEHEFGVLILRALDGGVVREETWRRFLESLRTYRDRDFMTYYVSNYPHLPFGATVQETSFLKRGVRAVIHDIQEPALNRDAARFAPVLDELAALATAPYHAAEPALQDIIREYRLVPHDRHSYSNESGARASIVNLIHVVFPRNATIQLQIDIFSIVIALERTRMDSGAYPDTLDGAAEFLGASVPLNPMDGTSYRYELIGDGFRLGVELDHPVPLTVLDQQSTALWVESVKGELEIGNGE